MDEVLQREQLALERERLTIDSGLRNRELDLKALEFEATFGKGLRVTVAQASVLVALISLAGAAIGAAVSGYFQRQVGDIEAAGGQSIEVIRANAQIDLERLKFESSLILKAIEQPNLDERIKSLRFFANAGLIPSHKDDVLSLSADRNAIPALDQAKPVCPFRKTTVTFSLDESVPASDSATLTEKLKEVYQQWSSATGLNILPAGKATAADIIVGYTDNNVVAFSEFPCNGRLAKIHLSSGRDWSSASSNVDADKDARFLFTVLLHEAGHTVGLHHREAADSVMSMPPPDLVKLADSDIEAARRLYFGGLLSAEE